MCHFLWISHLQIHIVILGSSFSKNCSIKLLHSCFFAFCDYLPRCFPLHFQIVISPFFFLSSLSLFSLLSSSPPLLPPFSISSLLSSPPLFSPFFSPSLLSLSSLSSSLFLFLYLQFPLFPSISFFLLSFLNLLQKPKPLLNTQEKLLYSTMINPLNCLLSTGILIQDWQKIYHF